MSIREKTIVDFFAQVANQDACLMHALEQDRRFSIESDRWYFTLPDLFSFMSRRCEDLRTCTYLEFRCEVYKSAINATVKKLGAEVIIDTNHRKTDKSVYAVVWDVDQSSRE